MLVAVLGSPDFGGERADDLSVPYFRRDESRESSNVVVPSSERSVASLAALDVGTGAEVTVTQSGVVIRCNAGSEVGLGHLVRCRALAEALHDRGVRCAMVGPSLQLRNSSDERVFADWVSIPSWRGPVAEVEILERYTRRTGGFNGVVIDHYSADEDFQRLLRRSGLRWMQFESRLDCPIWANVVLNAGPSARPSQYGASLRNREALLLLGPRYAILRSEFRSLAQRKHRSRVEEVLVMFGGGHDRGAIRHVLSALIPGSTDDVHFTVVSGASNPDGGALARWAANEHPTRVRVIIDPPDVAALMQRADLAVMAAGTSTFEAAACSMPMILVTVADNQIEQARGWAASGAALLLGSIRDVTSAELLQGFTAVSGQDARTSLAEQGRALVDGNGADRVAEILVRHLLDRGAE